MELHFDSLNVLSFKVLPVILHLETNQIILEETWSIANLLYHQIVLGEIGSIANLLYHQIILGSLLVWDFKLEALWAFCLYFIVHCVRGPCGDDDEDGIGWYWMVMFCHTLCALSHQRLFPVMMEMILDDIEWWWMVMFCQSLCALSHQRDS